jgi:hypothetical protein
MKRWCTRQLEEGLFSSRKEFSLAASKFLFRKVLPSPADNPIPGYLKKMATPRPSNPRFMEFVSERIPALFKSGWDKEYASVCERVTVKRKACLERKRTLGGSREHILGTLSHSGFLDVVLGRSTIELSPERKVMVIDDSGKKRIVTVASAFQHTLLPLHLLLYSHLSKKNWLLKGDAKPNSFKDFTITSGEVFVSGDYESATDNFVTAHSAHILAEIFKISPNIPAGVKSMALGRFSSAILTSAVGGCIQQSGQLMGDLLSFPLLCLTNFLAFKYAVPRRVPLRINGDDIVFRATRAEYEVWSRSVSDSGLTLSKGKTLIHRVFFSLNSTFFQAGYQKASLVPVIRSKSIYDKLERGGAKMRSRIFSSTQGFWAEAKEEIKKHFLRFHRKAVQTLPCSLNRGLGVRVAPASLKSTRVLDHELHYMQQPAACDAPPPVRSEDGIPAGWSRRKVGCQRMTIVGKDPRIKGESPKVYGSTIVSQISDSKIAEQEKLFQQACYQHAWTKGAGSSEPVEGLWMGYTSRLGESNPGFRLVQRMWKNPSAFEGSWEKRRRYGEGAVIEENIPRVSKKATFKKQWVRIERYYVSTARGGRRKKKERRVWEKREDPEVQPRRTIDELMLARINSLIEFKEAPSFSNRFMKFFSFTD